MAIPVYNYTWPQGSDLDVSLVYNEGPDGFEIPISLVAHQLRMDICDSVGTRLATLNSHDIGQAGVDVVGASDNEVTLGAAGQISILVPRGLTLTGGTIFTELAAGNNVFYYDVFIRNAAGKQTKILRGQITVEDSFTLWA